MIKNELRTITDQVVEQLKQRMAEGLWNEELPGRKALSELLGCSAWTIEEAVRRLTLEGLLVSEGPGKRRRIITEHVEPTSRRLRLQILLYEPSDRHLFYILELTHNLEKAGHDVSFAVKTMQDLGMSLKRISAFVSSTKADAWIIQAGSREVLSWFAERPTPAFALFGRLMQVPLAGASLSKSKVYEALVDQLYRLGHRRMAYVVREDRRKPAPGFLERAFLNALENHGIQTSNYNLPDWEETTEGLRKLLDSLFRHSPPSALLVDEPSIFFAVRDHLARKGIHAPEHVSLIACDPDPNFDWHLPPITHITWNARPLINRVVKWAKHVSQGTPDVRKSTTKVWLVHGGTIGRARKQ